MCDKVKDEGVRCTFRRPDRRSRFRGGESREEGVCEMRRDRGGHSLIRNADKAKGGSCEKHGTKRVNIIMIQFAARSIRVPCG